MIPLITFKEWAKNTPVRFTRHAIMRLEETGLNLIEGKRALYQSVKEFPNKDINRYKKYSNDGFTYWRNGSIIYALKRVEDKMSFKPLLLVITVTEQKVILKHLWQK